MKKKNSLSIVIIAKNEEKKITDCIKSAVWANEVIVIDNASIDKTATVAKRMGAEVTKVSEEYSLKYSKLRNLGKKKAKGRWIFYVDADERVTPSLRKEISQLVKKPASEFSAYAIPRRNVILGREMKYGGWWPDYVKRLFLKDKVIKWKGDLHEEPIFSGQMGHLKNSLMHIKHDNLEEMVEKTNKWSEIEAKTMYDAGHPQMNIVRFTTAMLREFWLRMVKNTAFMDGPEGIIYALYQVWSRFITYAKLWELQL